MEGHDSDKFPGDLKSVRGRGAGNEIGSEKVVGFGKFLGGRGIEFSRHSGGAGMDNTKRTEVNAEDREEKII